MNTVPTRPWREFWPDFAVRHGLEGQAHLVDEWIDPTSPSGVRQRWAITVVTPLGVIVQEDVATDGSYTPCPFDVALSWFVHEDYWVTDPEFEELVDAIGAAAVAELVMHAR